MTKKKTLLEKIEGDIDRIIKKYRESDYPINRITKSIVDKTGEGFMIMMISQRGEKTALRLFGKDISKQSIKSGMVEAVLSMELSMSENDNDNIGIA